MAGLRGWHIAVVVILLLLLFGAKRLPDAARGLGRSLRIFKAETEGLMKDDVKRKAEAQHERGPITDDRGTPDVADDIRRGPVVESRVVDSRNDTPDQR